MKNQEDKENNPGMHGESPEMSAADDAAWNLAPGTVDASPETKAGVEARGPSPAKAPGATLAEPEWNEETFFERFSRPRSTQWLFVWADLMMVMFIFFLVLYLFVTVKERETGTGELPGLKDLRPRILDQPAETTPFDYRELVVEGADIDSISNVGLAPDRAIRIVVTGDILFASASAELLPEASPFLEKVAAVIRDTPHSITVIGHTDDIPIVSSRLASNWELSALRAAAVVRQLIAKSGVSPGQFQVAGQAEFHPIVPNSTPENRRKNRRVEIVITRDLPEGGLPAGSGLLNEPAKPAALRVNPEAENR